MSHNQPKKLTHEIDFAALNLALFIHRFERYCKSLSPQEYEFEEFFNCLDQSFVQLDGHDRRPRIHKVVLMHAFRLFKKYIDNHKKGVLTIEMKLKRGEHGIITPAFGQLGTNDRIPFITLLKVVAVVEEIEAEVESIIFSLRDKILSTCNYQASMFPNYVTIHDAIVDILLTDTASRLLTHVNVPRMPKQRKSYSELVPRHENRLITAATKFVRFYFEACDFATKEISKIISRVSLRLFAIASIEETEIQSKVKQDEEIDPVQQNAILYAVNNQ